METPEEQEKSLGGSKRDKTIPKIYRMGREKTQCINFSGKVKKNESTIDLSGFCGVFSIIKSAFRNIYIC